MHNFFFMLYLLVYLSEKLWGYQTMCNPHHNYMHITGYPVRHGDLQCTEELTFCISRQICLFCTETVILVFKMFTDHFLLPFWLNICQLKIYLFTEEKLCVQSYQGAGHKNVSVICWRIYTEWKGSHSYQAENNAVRFWLTTRLLVHNWVKSFLKYQNYPKIYNKTKWDNYVKFGEFM